MESRFVRLESGSGKPTKKKSAGAVEHTLKLAIRLNEGVNDALRGLIRYRGDLSAMAIEALTTVDLGTVTLVSVEEKMVRDTTITIPRVVHKKLKKISTERETSMNILVNTALAHWLAQKGALRLR
ncbi:MAG: hypothetical protein K1X67_20695 [Fimbriimonadaceae bacterium]|jgi:hypothetical protein|nr:hypothetical protein [Fimbriimonadaceae bacterium]